MTTPPTSKHVHFNPEVIEISAEPNASNISVPQSKKARSDDYALLVEMMNENILKVLGGLQKLNSRQYSGSQYRDRGL